MTDTIKYLLDESRIPKHWYNLQADLPRPAAGRAASRHAPADRPRRPRPALPAGADPAGGVDRARDRDPRARCARSTGCGGRRRSSAPGGSSRRSRRRPRSTTSTKASARPAATSRTPRCRRRTTTRRRASSGSPPRPARASGASSLAFAGALFGLEVQVFMVRVCYDQKPYRRALMETYGARCVASPSTETAVGPRDPGAASRPPRQPRHRDLRGGRGRRAARRHEVRARQRAEPRAAAPDGDRPGGDRADGDGRRLPRHHRRLHRRRLELRRHRVPVHRRAAARRPQGRASSPSSRRRARA